MKRNVAVVGAGQAGLVLALGLLQRGHRVTLFAERPADAVRTGPATGSSVLLGRSVQIERDLGINLWDGTHQTVDAIQLVVHVPAPAPPLRVVSRLTTPGSPVDQRLKFATWQGLFADRGGRLVIGQVTPAELDPIAADHDLVVVAAGRGALGALFARDAERSVFDRPQRALTQFYVTGLNVEDAGTGTLHVLPGVGEFITLPFFVADGYRCDVVLIEAVPGGPLDRFPTGEPATAALAAMRKAVGELLPSLVDVVAATDLAGDNAILRGSVTPEVREPVGHTPHGRPVAGIGDTVIINDPIAGQGANSATRWAYDLVERIDATAGPLDEAWMRSMFDSVWEDARHATNLSNALLAPPPPHRLAVLGAASQNPSIAADVIHGFEDPALLHPWFFEPDAAERFLAEHTGAI